MEGMTLTDDRVICDSCGQQTDIELWTRQIAKDRNGYDVTEQYFECKNCGKHYTVGVYDRCTTDRCGWTSRSEGRYRRRSDCTGRSAAGRARSSTSSGRKRT